MQELMEGVSIFLPPSLPFHALPFPFPPIPSLFPLLLCPFPVLLPSLRSLPLEVDPLNQLKGLGERYNLPRPKTNLVLSRAVRKSLVAMDLSITEHNTYSYQVVSIYDHYFFTYIRI